MTSRNVIQCTDLVRFGGYYIMPVRHIALSR